MGLTGPGNFAHSHFFGLLHGAGGGQIHIIDAGNQNDKERNRGENVNVFYIAFMLIPIRCKILGIKMDIRQGLNINRLHVLAVFLLVFLQQREKFCLQLVGQIRLL